MMKAAAKEARVGVKEITSLGRGGCLEEVPPRPALIRTVDRGREGGGGGGQASAVNQSRAGRSQGKFSGLLKRLNHGSELRNQRAK